MTAEPAPGNSPGWHALDPRKIDLDRAVGLIVTTVLSFVWLLAVGLISVVGVPGLLAAGLALAWLPFTAVVAVLLYRWPMLDYRLTRYRVDDEVIEIRRGVLWRTATVVPRSRVQHLDVAQGPLMRRYGLGVLVVFTAGSEYSRVALPGLAFEAAQALRDRLLPRESQVDGV